MVISYSAETETAMVEAYYVILMKIFYPTVNVEGIVKECEIFLIEFSINTRKCLFIGLYKTPSQNENNFLDNLSLIINRRTYQYENSMLIVDLSITIENKNLEVVMNSLGLECLTKKPKCFQSKNPSCIDLILANKKDFLKIVMC